jgi:hypothetical protein
MELKSLKKILYYAVFTLLIPQSRLLNADMLTHQFQ